MVKIPSILFSFIASFSIAACSQSICPDGSQGSCEAAASIDAGSGGGGGADTCSNPNESMCGTTCVDLDVTATFCGSCDNACSATQGCSAGVCVDLCAAGEISCSGTCIDPQTDAKFCGASGSCTEFKVGEDCGTYQCSAGVCTTKRYLGSLTTSSGLWNYGGTIGEAGAVTACQTLYNESTAVVCSYANLVEAQGNGELVNATDNNNVAVSQWWIVDATANQLRQCTDTDPALSVPAGPWSYQTAHRFQGAKFVSLDGAAGTVTQVVDAAPSGTTGCGAMRNVPCCMP